MMEIFIEDGKSANICTVTGVNCNSLAGKNGISICIFGFWFSHGVCLRLDDDVSEFSVCSFFTGQVNCQVSCFT